MPSGRSKFLALAALSLLSVAASCDRGPKANATPAATAESTDQRIESLPGIDTSQLTDAEVETWTALVNEQLSTCGDPASVARCVAGAKCAACAPAARYLTRLVLEGYDKQTIEQHFGGRFDKKTKVELQFDEARVFGAPMAPVTIVEFSDFQCPHCAAAHPELERLVREFEGQVKLAFKHFPLSSHTHAIAAARAAEAAGRQGKFWAMHDLLFEHQGELEDANLERYASMLELDLERFKADFASAEVAARVDADRKDGERLGLEGTPTLYVNGRLLREPLKALPAYLKEELEL